MVSIVEKWERSLEDMILASLASFFSQAETLASKSIRWWLCWIGFIGESVSLVGSLAGVHRFGLVCPASWSSPSWSRWGRRCGGGGGGGSEEDGSGGL